MTGSAIRESGAGCAGDVVVVAAEDKEALSVWISCLFTIITNTILLRAAEKNAEKQFEAATTYLIPLER